MAALNLLFIANTIPIGIRLACAIAIEIHRAAQQFDGLACSVIIGGRWIEVTGGFVGAAFYLIIPTDTVPIGIVLGIERTGIEEIAHPIFVRIVEASAIAIVPFIRVFTRD